MAPTYTTDIANWLPDIISAAMYDLQATPLNALVAYADGFDGLEGTPGDTFLIPTVTTMTPADNLAETVPAVDDKLTSGGVSVTLKEEVKSVAWSDRARVQSTIDLNRISGQKLGNAMVDRIELDLGAAAVAGRDTAKDAYVAGPLTLANLRALRGRMIASVRRRGTTVFIPSSRATGLLDDATVNNAATFGSSDIIESGDFSRPLYGMRIVEVDDSVFPNVVVGANPSSPPVVMIANGMLKYGYQKRPSVEVERDARARLTRIVGTAMHAEGVLDSRGVIITTVGA